MNKSSGDPCYTPQFGSAKDPVNFAGMVAADVLRGDMPLSHWDAAETGFLLDVREPVELAAERVPGVVNIHYVNSEGVCASSLAIRISWSSADPGQRAYAATRILLNRF